jgi:hypothetical protein
MLVKIIEDIVNVWNVIKIRISILRDSMIDSFM